MAFTIICQGSSITLADEDFRHAVHVESRKIRDFITNYAEEAAAGKTFDAADDPRNIAWRCQEGLKLARSYILTRFDDKEDHVAALWAAKRDLVAYSDNPDLAYGWRRGVAKQAIEYFDQILISVLPGIRIF